MIDGVVLAVRQPLTDAELNALFAAAWPDHRQVRFEPVLQRSLIWIAARSGDRCPVRWNASESGLTFRMILWSPDLPFGCAVIDVGGQSWPRWCRSEAGRRRYGTIWLRAGRLGLAIDGCPV